MADIFGFQVDRLAAGQAKVQLSHSSITGEKNPFPVMPERDSEVVPERKVP
jgi:hypothetical protein